jgi:hypothetical protein
MAKEILIENRRTKAAADASDITASAGNCFGRAEYVYK